jgi:hypothetical protein
MHLLTLVVLGVLASIGALTLLAMACVIRFGDGALSDIHSWDS